MDTRQGWGCRGVAPGETAGRPESPLRFLVSSRSFSHGTATMASDHQTQAGKPQALNPKVGTVRGRGGRAERVPQTRRWHPHPWGSPSLPASLCASVSPTCPLKAPP